MTRDWTREEFSITDDTPVVDIDSLEKKCERLQKQLDIALTGLKTIKSMEFERYLMANGWVAVGKMRETAKTYIKQVEELNEIHKQE